MSQFLLPCSCGAKTPVSRSQAGMSVHCNQCGKTVDVPTIRQLNQLESAESAGRPTLAPSSRSPGLLLRILPGIFLLLSLGFLGYGGLMVYERWTFPSDLKMTEEEYLKITRDNLRDLSPASTWDTWNNLADNGLMNLETPNYFRYQRAFQESAPKMYLNLGIGTASFLGFLTCILLSRRRR